MEINKSNKFNIKKETMKGKVYINQNKEYCQVILVESYYVTYICNDNISIMNCHEFLDIWKLFYNPEDIRIGRIYKSRYNNEVEVLRLYNNIVYFKDKGMVSELIIHEFLNTFKLKEMKETPISYIEEGQTYLSKDYEGCEVKVYDIRDNIVSYVGDGLNFNSSPERFLERYYLKPKEDGNKTLNVDGELIKEGQAYYNSDNKEIRILRVEKDYIYFILEGIEYYTKKDNFLNKYKLKEVSNRLYTDWCTALRSGRRFRYKDHNTFREFPEFMKMLNYKEDIALQVEYFTTNCWEIEPIEETV